MTEDELRELLQGNSLTPPPGVSTAPLATVKRRAKRRLRLTAGFSAVAVCALAGLMATSLRGSAPPVATEQCGGGVPVFSSARPVTTGPTPQPINAGSLSEIANAAGLIGEERFPESYAGVAMDTETDRVTVWRRHSPDFDRELKALPGHEKIVIRCADHSLRELRAAWDRVLADLEYWKAQGLPVNQSAPRIDGSCVDIYSPDPARWEAAFTARYPGVPLCFVKGGDWLEPIPFSS